jgi:hypothetical protein
MVRKEFISGSLDFNIWFRKRSGIKTGVNDMRNDEYLM